MRRSNCQRKEIIKIAFTEDFKKRLRTNHYTHALTNKIAFKCRVASNHSNK